MPAQKIIPSRLHHAAFISTDLERTRRFYEEIIGLPLIATYREVTELFGKARRYCHCFFGIEDGSALAFFQFVDPEDIDKFVQRPPATPFFHTSLKCDQQTQDAIIGRLSGSDYEPSVQMIDHGYCKSLYVTDPDGVLLEFTVDSDLTDPLATNFTDPHGELARWLAGDRAPNNPLRSDASAAHG